MFLYHNTYSIILTGTGWSPGRIAMMSSISCGTDLSGHRTSSLILWCLMTTVWKCSGIQYSMKKRFFRSFALKNLHPKTRDLYSTSCILSVSSSIITLSYSTHKIEIEILFKSSFDVFWTENFVFTICWVNIYKCTFLYDDEWGVTIFDLTTEIIIKWYEVGILHIFFHSLPNPR